jgi:hypothetical protein
MFHQYKNGVSIYGPAPFSPSDVHQLNDEGKFHVSTMERNLAV